jgi:hypothetical protein
VEEPSTQAVEVPGAPTPRPAVSAAGAVIGLLLGLLGFALAVQLRGNTTDTQLATARPDDLVRILSDLDSRSDRLRTEIRDLEDSRRQLESGAQGREAALAAARRRADDLGILAGTAPAVGPGLTIVFTPRDEPIRAATLLDAVQELRGAGAEAMQIRGSKGATVRVVASTYFVDSGATSPSTGEPHGSVHRRGDRRPADHADGAEHPRRGDRQPAPARRYRVGSGGRHHRGVDAAPRQRSEVRSAGLLTGTGRVARRGTGTGTAERASA